jgi:hypothetical protein
MLGAVALNEVRVSRDRQARSAAAKQRRAAVKQRYALFDMLQPVALANCQLERFGEPHDGGYLMCANLLAGAQAGYSYGISGYDQWGCDISRKFKVTVHQYDCFDLTEPACPGGTTVFHAECVGPTPQTVEGRVFDAIANQFASNGDSSKRIVLKIDVEGAEWDAFLSASDAVFEQIEQMAVEFHWFRDADLRWTPKEKHVRALQRLKQFFVIAHVHYNNAACAEGLEPFPTWAYEVLFVNKRLAVVDPSRKAGGLHPLDAPNDPRVADCQPRGR